MAGAGAEPDSATATVPDAARRSLDPAAGAMVRVVWFDAGDAPGRLLLVLHHLVVDGVSWRILLPDLVPYRPSTDGHATVAAVQGDVPGSGDNILLDYRQVTRNHVDATIDLGATPMRILPSQASARGRLRDLFDVVIPWLHTARMFQDAIDASVQVSMPFEGEIPKVNMSFQGTMGRGTLWGRGFDWGRIGARIVEGEKAVIDTAELHRGEAVAEGTGTVHFPAPSPWSLSVDFSDLALDGLGLDVRERRKRVNRACRRIQQTDWLVHHLGPAHKPVESVLQ